MVINSENVRMFKSKYVIAMFCLSLNVISYAKRKKKI